MIRIEPGRRCFHCLSYYTYHHKKENRPQWHNGIITFDNITGYRVWYCHRCYNKWIYNNSKPKPKPKKKVIPSILVNAGYKKKI